MDLIRLRNTASPARVLMAAALVAGEWAGFASRTIAPIWPAVAVAGATAGLAAWGWRLRGWTLPALFVLGFVLALRADDGLARILASNHGDATTRAPVELAVESEPERWRTSRQGQWRASFVSHIGAVPVKVVMPTTAVGDLPRLGETWSCRGRISEKTAGHNRFARRTFWIARSEHARRLAPVPAFSAKSLYGAIAQDLSVRLSAGLDWCPELAKLNSAILLGRRGGLSREKRRLFADAGTIHVFAISGLHVMVVALLIRNFLTRLNVTGPFQNLAAIPLIWIYTVLTGLRPSAVRAALMATFWLGAPVLGRKPDSLSAWSATALLVYGLHPEMLFDVGSTLSFTVMLGIVLWIEWTRNFKPLFRDGFRTGRFARVFGEYGAANRLLSGFGISLAAWIAGVPIAASVFGRFTPGGLIANLAVLYCAEKMVKIGMAGLLASFFCLPLAALFNNCAAGFTWAMARLSQCIAALPCASYAITSWTLSATLLWYGGWITLLLVIGHFLPAKTPVRGKWWT
ncbi:MAG: ComEC/Rec2 family competence protein [Kiritimatiellia bacterium]